MLAGRALRLPAPPSGGHRRPGVGDWNRKIHAGRPLRGTEPPEEVPPRVAATTVTRAGAGVIETPLSGPPRYPGFLPGAAFADDCPLVRQVSHVTFYRS
ncbi:hypothetical protein GCM10010151_07930 [Actinoallomurus spadix]|uniref:Uncharacterized protein n=1 Tax=Actinoallomurus spadix TaxID=79912 RepID=A0ABP3FPD4_9ACTN